MTQGPTAPVPTRERLRADLCAVADLPYDGEAVDQLAHALQCGTLAVRAGARPAVVAAALLHDIGRSPGVSAQLPDAPHERAGAAYCTRLLGHEVGWLVGAHVLAKRALVTLDPGYAALLSPVSVRSLEQQGGPAASAELDRFLRHPLAREAMDVRRWDDEAKVPGAPTMALDELLDVAIAA
ncbi:HD domain-containing protein [Pseudonocardia kunmingensis]|uniref:Putative HD phosphohydrolase n=1 Tax=Pseudonocardia kunmingensis TaxID=630975 RepID=A0A543DNH5_9PSEU|nr:HD domain-containing protein [Pseudonocardia kunmingensis]TQM10843.1 putative HD phosphohydrolase [Pseudonocardia kunmingensis]